MTLDKDNILNIIESCKICNKDTLHILNNEKKTLQCLECREITDISNSYVTPMNGKEID